MYRVWQKTIPLKFLCSFLKNHLEFQILKYARKAVVDNAKLRAHVNMHQTNIRIIIIQIKTTCKQTALTSLTRLASTYSDCPHI